MENFYNNAVKFKQKNCNKSVQMEKFNNDVRNTSCSTFQRPSCRQDKLHQLSQVLSPRQGLLRGREDNITSSFTSGLLATTHNGQRHRRRTSAVTIVLFRSLSTCISIFLYYCRHQIHDEAHCVLVLFDIQLNF